MSPATKALKSEQMRPRFQASLQASAVTKLKYSDHVNRFQRPQVLPSKAASPGAFGPPEAATVAIRSHNSNTPLRELSDTTM